MPGTSDHLVGIILAGGDGRRLQRLIRVRYRSDRPKQYCAFIGTRSMLRHTIDRAERVIAPQRLLTIVNYQHLPYAREQLRDRPSGTVIVQPCNRETVPGLLLPLLHVYHRDPDATVAVFPSDHFVLKDERFVACVEDAAAFVAQSPGLLVLVGVDPDRPEAEYGWIEPGEKIRSQQGEQLYHVKRFVEKPDIPTAETLYLKGCLWNTLVLVGRTETLLELAQALTPEVFRAFERVRTVLGSPQEENTVADVYATLPTLNFSRAILERSAPRLRVLRCKGVYWSDWGDEERIRLDLSRFGLQPCESAARHDIISPTES